MLDEEKKYRQILESLLKHKVYRNPKPKGDGFRSADFIVENLNESWDVKGLDGKSKSLIENTLGNACKKRQAPYLMLHKRNTPKKIRTLKKELIYLFESNKKIYIKQVMLFDKNDKLILYLKR